MRDDVYIAEVLEKCDVLKRAGMWPGQPRMRPGLWLRNFDDQDKVAAAALLDKFTFYSARLTDALLVASFYALGDGSPKCNQEVTSEDLVKAVENAVFTPVLGEIPDPTDSGNYLCRKARQLLFPECKTVNFDAALNHAYQSNPVIFVDDFIGSGDQFIHTWCRDVAGKSFHHASENNGFVAIYVALVATSYGISQINQYAPNVYVSVTHVLRDRSTLDGLLQNNPGFSSPIEHLLEKYAPNLNPREDYIRTNINYLKYGYKERKLLLAFDHSVPDATLPIFWAPGRDNWEPLIERT